MGALRIDPDEPCERCGNRGDSRLYMPTPADLFVWCDDCIDKHRAAERAERERALLADWGTLRERQAGEGRR